MHLSWPASSCSCTRRPRYSQHRRAWTFSATFAPSFQTTAFSATVPTPRRARRTCGWIFTKTRWSPRRNGAPIVPGKPEQSLALQEDYGSRSRPADAAALDAQDADATRRNARIKRWIEQGADWKQHWAFVAPVRPALPAVKDRKWSRTPIDRFVLAKIEAAGLDAESRSGPPRAHPPRVARSDGTASATRRRRGVRRRHVGRTRTRRWSTGCCRLRITASTAPAIGSTRRGTGTPTACTTTTIAAASGRIATGSSRPSTAICRSIGLRSSSSPATCCRIRRSISCIATGFVRNNTTTNENGVIEEEVRFQYIKDRADTAGTVFLGLTVGCATCHDHKFDPISQKDHYALEAFFNNTTERIMDNNRPDPPPVAIVPADRDRARWLELEALRKSHASAHDGGAPGSERAVRSVAGIRGARAVAGSIGECGAAGGFGGSGDRRVCVDPALSARLPFDTGVTADGESPWHGLPRPEVRRQVGDEAARSRSDGQRALLDGGVGAICRRLRCIRARPAARTRW